MYHFIAKLFSKSISVTIYKIPIVSHLILDTLLYRIKTNLDIFIQLL